MAYIPIYINVFPVRQLFINSLRHVCAKLFRNYPALPYLILIKRRTLSKRSALHIVDAVMASITNIHLPGRVWRYTAANLRSLFRGQKVLKCFKANGVLA